MPKKLQDWLDTDVRPFREKPLTWLSQYHFFRDPIRPTYSDLSYFFSPADGIILYQRVLTRIYSVDLAQPYYLLQIADQDIDRITPFVLRQNQLVAQGQRFSQVRYGSQVDLIVPLSAEFAFETVQETGDHVEAGIDPIIMLAEGAMR